MIKDWAKTADYKKASGKDIPYNIAPRRDGDMPAYWAEPKKANSLLGWSIKYYR